MAAVPLVRADLTSFQIAHPLVRRTSWAELTAVATLSVAAIGLWLIVLPLELLAFGL